LRVLTWESGTSVEEKRLHVALIVPCGDDCDEALKKGLELFKLIEPSPIVTWSDHYNAFVLATRVPRRADEVKGFCENVLGAYVEACESVGRESALAEPERFDE